MKQTHLGFQPPGTASLTRLLKTAQFRIFCDLIFVAGWLDFGIFGGREQLLFRLG